jgi:hypothetical protein
LILWHPAAEILFIVLLDTPKMNYTVVSISSKNYITEQFNQWSHWLPGERLGVKLQQGWGCFLCCRLRLKCDGTRAETRFCLSAIWTSPFKSAGALVQSTTGSRGVRISGSDVGYTMFRGSVKGTGYPLHSPVSLHFPSRTSPCAITFQLDFTSRHGRILNMHWVVFAGSMAASVWSHTPRSTAEMKNLKHMQNYKLYLHNTVNQSYRILHSQSIIQNTTSLNRYLQYTSFTAIPRPRRFLTVGGWKWLQVWSLGRGEICLHNWNTRG